MATIIFIWITCQAVDFSSNYSSNGSCAHFYPMKYKGLNMSPETLLLPSYILGVQKCCNYKLVYHSELPQKHMIPRYFGKITSPPEPFNCYQDL